MSLKDSDIRHEKKEEGGYGDFSYSNKGQININSLNDDCLIQVFKFLPFIDRLNVELVCKRWISVGRQSWSDVKTINVDYETWVHCDLLKYKMKFQEQDHLCCKPFHFANIQKNVIKRSGLYINNLVVEILYDRKFSEVLKTASEYCVNLNSIKIIGNPKDEQYFQENLGLLFKNNSKISTIVFLDLKINGECLKELNPNSIENLSIKGCKIKSQDHLYNLYSKLTNLKVFDVYDNAGVVTRVHNLNNSNCKNISEFCIKEDSDEDYMKGLPELLSKQTRLSKLRLNWGESGELLKVVSTEPLQHLSIEYYEGISKYVSKFKNLTYFQGWIEELTDKCMLALKECFNLKTIDFIEICEYLLTSVGEKCFSSFENLKEISILVDFEVNHDNLIKEVANCKRLEKVSFINFRLTDVGFNYIKTLPNLEFLEIYTCETNLKTEHFLDLILHSLKLKTFIYSQRPYSERLKIFTFDFFKIINNLKCNRGDKETLYFYICKKTFEELENDLSELELLEHLSVQSL